MKIVMFGCACIVAHFLVHHSQLSHLNALLQKQRNPAQSSYARQWLWLLLVLMCLSWTCKGNANPVQTVDLSGTWNFTPLSGTTTTIQVPGGGWYKQGFTSISEADYSTSISIPSIGQPQVTKLEFGAVNYQADLYVNGTLVGSSIQSFTPATFDISNYVVPGNSYSIRVHVKGRSAFMSNGKSLVPNAAGWSTNTPQGIFRSAKLLIYPQVYISDVFVRPLVKNNNLYYDVWLTNASSSTANIVLSGSLNSWNGNTLSYPALPSQSVALASGTTAKVTVGPISWNLGSGSYWWPNVPYQTGYTAQLHLLNLSIAPSTGGSVMDQTSTRFGFRELLQQSDGTNTCYFLNGIRVNFRGDSLQGADYDSITYGEGKSDAYDTLPGFLSGTNGWPKAVDNYQRLNYNFVRLHQEPVSPYMLDICDEKGLMVMEETAIRGSANDQDFTNGHDNMVNHLKALYTRDRNHPAIVRQSLSNEPNQSSTDSTQFETDLYNAAMSVDGTRPLSIDVGTPANTYETMTYSNFSVYRHYGTGNQFGQYVENAFVRTDRPYGEGEFIWSADNTLRGFTWFATATQAMRAQGASDLRPYTLLSAWASFVPGVNRTEMTLEQGGNPVYGEDNLPSPWTNSQIQRVQAGFNPVLVADAGYWAFTKLSDTSGNWPANIPFIGAAQSVTRQLTIYNDTFSGTAVDVFWELRQDSATGPIAASGVVNATVPLGYSTTQSITFTTPNAPNGINFYLVLYAKMRGVELFRESSEQFVMLNQLKLTGSAFGSTPSYSAGSEYDKASDGNLNTYFDYQNASGGYTGIDLGANNAKRVSAIVFSPRAGFESRMIGGVFRGSNDGVNYTTIYTVASTPSANTTVLVNTYQAYRYLEYVGPSNSYCDIAEMAFYTMNQTPLGGTAFGASPAYSAGHEYDKVSDEDTSTYYDYANADNGYTGIDLGANNARKIGFIVFTPRANVNSYDYFENRMVGGVFQGSNSGVNYTTLSIITSTPPSNQNSTTVFVNTPTAYRYLKYSAPAGSYGDIAEMAFYPLIEANLSNLALSAGTLTPAFASGTTSYSCSVSNTTSTITVTPTLTDSTAKVTVNSVSVVSGTASQPISLNVGSNIVTVQVTASDGLTTKTYSLSVTRQSAIETWRQTWYNSTNNSGDASDTADPYHTGVPNLATFAFLGPNQDPSKVVIGRLPKAQMIGNSFGYNLSQPPGVSGITYGAEWSTTLAAGSWQSLTDNGTGSNHIFLVQTGSNKRLSYDSRLRIRSPLDTKLDLPFADDVGNSAITFGYSLGIIFLTQPISK